ncbi:hypothetical protein F4861DRAFT_279740 [Xylaria intraflava]|nr:hypothetical protein F4861DRAFT_279740 [Xylaria intraflava]
MSAVKFNSYPTYKLFEPQYHPQRPIIIDAEAIESPETVTLRYEEEAAARANGGDLRGDSPPGLLGIESCTKTQAPPMHSFDSTRSYQDPQYPYAGQSFPQQQSENAAAAAQLNHLAFTANSSASQYMSPSAVLTVTSYQPTSGVCGTKFVIKLSATYDLISVASRFVVAFGPHKCPAHAIREASDASGIGYVVSGEVPQLDDTRNPSGNVPVSLLVEGSEGETLGSIDVGTFAYHDGAQAVGAEGPHEDVTRKPSSKSPDEEQRTIPSKHEAADADQLIDTAPPTNTYGYAPTTHQAVASSYDAGYPSNSTNSMLSTYHRSSYGAEYPRPPLLKTPSWSYGPSLSSPRSPAGLHHATSISRPTVTALPIPTSSTPEFVRTSTLQAPTGTSGHGSVNPYAPYPTKAVLKINGDLESMASNWTAEECEKGRRLVLFSKKQQGSTLTTTFKPVSASERPPNSICISCIYWAEKRECFVTSVDTISLLEQLVLAPRKFNVEEKNRIRRNLEGFRPLTVSKAKPDSEEFFKVIMGFPSPKPRNIEKDVKVFPWKILAPALKKIISKYSASMPNSSSLHPVSSFHASPGAPALLTPVSSTSPNLYGAPPTPTIADPIYPHHDQTMVSPRPLSGAPSSWAPYTGRTLSPNLKPHSPGIRMPSLPSYSAQSAHSYGMAPHRWDATNGYGDVASAAPAYAGHQHAGHVYGAGAYGSSGEHRE